MIPRSICGRISVLRPMKPFSLLNAIQRPAADTKRPAWVFLETQAKSVRPHRLRRHRHRLPQPTPTKQASASSPARATPTPFTIHSLASIASSLALLYSQQLSSTHQGDSTRTCSHGRAPAAPMAAVTLNPSSLDFQSTPSSSHLRR